MCVNTIGQCIEEMRGRKSYLVSMDRQHVAARWIMAQESIGRRIWL